MSFKISNPFLRKSSSPLNTNHGQHNQNYPRREIRPQATMQLTELPQWVKDARDPDKNPQFGIAADPLRWLSEEEQAAMTDADRYKYYEAMLIDEQNRIAQLEQNIRDYSSSTAESDEETGDFIKTTYNPWHPNVTDFNQGNNYLPFYVDKESGDIVNPTTDIFRKNYPEISEWLGGNWACNSLSCSILAQNGYTIPRDVNGDGIVDDSDEVQSAFQGKLKGGDPMSIEPGTARFNEMHTELGFTLAPAGTQLDPNKVQLIRRSSWDRYQDPMDASDGTVRGMSDLDPNNPNYLGHGHSILTTGIADTTNPNLAVNIHGTRQQGTASGTRLDTQFGEEDRRFIDANNDGLPDIVDGSTYRIMNYTGDMPYWQKKIEGMAEWKAKYDAEQEAMRRELAGLPSKESQSAFYQF